MAVIRANRESIDDRFSVLGFTVRSELPLFEIGLATDPELLKPANRGKRTPANFFTSRLLRALPSQRGEAVFLVPPEAVARFIGQPRLYFGLATYRESDRNTPVSLRLPDRGSMYVNLSGLTERGLRRTSRRAAPNGYGYSTAGGELGWGGDAAGNAPAPSRDDERPRTAPASQAPSVSREPATYSDGYSDDLWTSPPAPAPVPAPAPAPTPAPAPASSAQSYAVPRTRALTPVSSDYHPSGLIDALRAQIGFFYDSAKWFFGVTDTTVMPHAAVCQVRNASDKEHGTAFFIAPRLLLTAAHVVDGQRELIIIPGKNGAGKSSGTEPFGRFKVSAADCEKFPAYTTNGDYDNDMAVIRVPAVNAAPAGRYFDLVDELLESRPEGVVVNGYAAYSAASPGTIGDFINNNIDPNRQHLMGGYIRELPSDGTFSYNLHTLGGTSGSPVYWIEDRSGTPQAHVVGVHIAPHDDTTNLGCRITADKIAWIRREAKRWGVTLSFSLGARALSDDGGDDDGHDIDGPIPDTYAEAQGYAARALDATQPEDPLSKRFVAAAPGNYRHVTGTRTIDRIVIHITDGGAKIGGTIGWFQNPDQRNAKGEHITVSAHYVIGQDGEIVQMVPHNDVAWHAGSANGTSIGIEHVANTRGLNPTVRQMEASAALVTWLCDKYGIDPNRRNILGHAEADGNTSHKACPNAVWNWDYYMELITTRSCVTPPPSMPQSLSYARAMSEDGADPALEPDEDSEEFGLSEDIPDEPGAQAQALSARALATETPDYPGTKRFVPAHKNNFKKMKPGRPIDRIVIHITAGGPKIDGTIAWFQNGNRVNPRTGKKIYSSAHYIVGRDGEVVQMVHDQDKAHHASAANKRSIGIEHNANKPYAGNKRDLPPTEPQYAASAKLVAWLCAHHGVPVDRDHIVGHKEISPKDNHDCPGSYWNWDHYMELVRAEAVALGIASEVGRATGSAVGGAIGGFVGGAAGGAIGSAVGGAVGSAVGGAVGAFQPDATAQSLGRAYASAQEVITPFYDPADPASALTCQADAFTQTRDEWFAGVPDTTFFPHSAICLLEMDDGSGGVSRGTGFYIGRNRILTCAHNLYGQAKVTIIPGKNGKSGAGTEPFGRTTVASSSWRIPASYAGSNKATDLAVIENVPIAAPNGQWFDELEELNQSRPEGVVVCGYSSRSDKLPELTKAIDGFKQHLHAGYIAALADDNSTFSYPILTLKRASGSPVYYISTAGGTPRSYVVGVHTGADTDDLNRGCRLMKNKIDWIEGRTTSLSLGTGHARALADDGPSDHDVHLIPQPDKNACWAASMAMLLAHRKQQSRTPESVINAVGGSLASSYSWELLKAVRKHYGFQMIAQPSNASLYHTPRQWAEWLNAYGPLWVVIVGAPHAVVLAGIRGDLDNPGSAEVKILNPWDTRVAFDNDPIEFHPENHGYEAWLPFSDFASDFGNMAEADYGNWRILHLPAAAAQAQSLSAQGAGLRLAPPPPIVRPLNAEGERREPIEPSRVAGTRMSRVSGEAGACRWRLDQLDGLKSPATPSYDVSSATGGTTKISLDDWPAIEGAPTPLPLTLEFRYDNGSVGDVRIVAGKPANLAYGVEVVAKIEDCADDGRHARIRVRVDYRFRGLAQGNPDAVIELCLRGDGQHERDNGWRNADALSPAA